MFEIGNQYESLPYEYQLVPTKHHHRSKTRHHGTRSASKSMERIYHSKYPKTNKKMAINKSNKNKKHAIDDIVIV